LECRDPPEKTPGPDIGAPEGGSPGPAVDFVPYDGGLYVDPPRIVRVDLPTSSPASTGATNALRIVFSVPIVLRASDVRAAFDYGTDDQPLASEPCQAVDRALTCAFAGELPATPLRQVRLPDAILGPTGVPATTWGSVADMVTLVR